jgi:hypothetical protein
VLPLAENDTLAMLDGLAHLRPLVNGDSGFIPRPFDRAMELLEHGLDAEALRFLRAVGVRHVTRPSLTAPQGGSAVSAAGQAAAVLPPGVREVAAFERERVLELEAGPRAGIVQPGEAVGTRWSSAGILLTLGEPRGVGRVTFELSDAPWVAKPSVEASLDGVTWEPVEATASLADATLSLYQDPKHARGEIRFAKRVVRHLRLSAKLPARGGALEVDGRLSYAPP